MASPHPLLTAVEAALRAVTAVSSAVPDYRALSDAEFAQVCALSATLLQQAQARSTLVAGEIDHRSRAELGSAGLAHRLGHRTPEAMVRATTGQTARDSHTAVRVGRLAHHSAQIEDAATGELPIHPQPWLAPVGRAVAAGAVSVAGAQSIASGLGSPSHRVSSDELQQLATQLVLLAGSLDADRLYRVARDARDELDLAGVAEREHERREARSLTLHRQPDGMVRLVWVIDPETAATVTDLYDRATSPRRGAPRFVDPEAARTADLLAADPRTTAQLASDTFAEVLAVGAALHDAGTRDTGLTDDSAGPNQMDSATDSVSPTQPGDHLLTLLRATSPAVRVLVTQRDLAQRSGVGQLEGQPNAISIATIERLACTGTVREITLDRNGQPLDAGRERRLFSHTQRIALAARDGGCRWPGCDRPPTWTEAHHVQFWQRDGGSTDVADGILLCRHHHLTLHNNHWEIDRRDSEYWLRPPPDVDPELQPTIMPSRSRAWLRSRAREPAAEPTHDRTREIVPSSR